MSRTTHLPSLMRLVKQGDKEALKTAQNSSLLSSAEHSEDFSTLFRLAKLGNSTAMLYLGFYHLFGFFGLPKAPEIAYYWFQQAAKNDSAMGFYQLGVSHRKGLGASQCNILAKHYFKLAQTRGCLFSASQLKAIEEESLANLSKGI